MIPITTKLLRNRWFCFATFDGYDYSYTGKTKEEAQNKMKARLKKSDLEGHGLFMGEQIIANKPNEQKPSINYSKSRIDNNPFG